MSSSVLASSGYMPRNGIAWSYGDFISSLLRISILSSIVVYIYLTFYIEFTFPQTVQESSLFSTPPPAFIVCRFFDYGYSEQCEVISHCSFDLHFSNPGQF